MDCTCLDAAIGEPAPLVFRSVSVPRRGVEGMYESTYEPVFGSQGRHWKDAMVDVGALVIIQSPQAHPCIHIMACSKAQVRDDGQSTDSSMDTGEPLRLWVLQPQELLVALEFCWDTDTSHVGGLTGVRITTNMRESPWYGGSVGTHVERLEAPSHFFINGVFASIVQGKEVEIGVRFEPKDRLCHHHDHSSRTVCDRDDELASSASCPMLRSLPELSLMPGDTLFTVSHYHLRAISVTTDTDSQAHLTKVDILSSRQYERMKVANRHGQRQALLAEHEDMVVLSATTSGTDGDHMLEKQGDAVMVAATGDVSTGSDGGDNSDRVEAITKVEIAYTSDHLSREVVVAIRLTTTHGGEGTWLGDRIQDTSTARVVTHETPVDGSDTQWKLTGFRGVCDQHDGIVMLEPLYHKVV